MAAPEADIHTAGTPWQATVLALIAGYADTLGFIAYGAFAGLVTGNTVLLVISVLHANGAQALHRASIIALFAAGLAIAASLRRIRTPVGALLGVEALALVAAAFLSPDAAPLALAFGMGVQNATITRFAGIPLNTVVVTGDIRKLVLRVVGRLFRRTDEAETLDPGAVAVIVVYAGYLGGAALAGVAFALVAKPLLLAPLPLPLVLLGRGAARN